MTLKRFFRKTFGLTLPLPQTVGKQSCPYWYAKPDCRYSEGCVHAVFNILKPDGPLWGDIIHKVSPSQLF